MGIENINKSQDFNIYYLNFSKVYEMAMMINNVVLTKIETNRSRSFEKQYGFTSSISAKGSKYFLDGIKATISEESKETSLLASKVVESLDVKTTKSILLRRVIERCTNIQNFDGLSEGDLIKIDNVKLEVLDEENLRQFLLLRRDALKGIRIEGMEINNLVSSMLQDYAYILKGSFNSNDSLNTQNEIIIKIPMEIQSEFENKYNINDLLIGHVSIVGIYKGKVSKRFICSNTFNYFQPVEENVEEQMRNVGKLIKSSIHHSSERENIEDKNDKNHFIDTLAIIQNVEFRLEKSPEPKLNWWKRLINWLCRFRRK